MTYDDISWKLMYGIWDMQKWKITWIENQFKQNHPTTISLPTEFKDANVLAT